MTNEAPAEVLAAVDQAVTAGLPRPEKVYARDDLPGEPFIHLCFGANDTADLDAWAAHVGAKVGFDDYTYGDVDVDDGSYIGAPVHEYGTCAEGSVYGRWLDREVFLGCEVLGPHTISQEASR